ncbi:heme peroxidase [Auriculariales sp. MPI-PUGE-AT-0066]|nr:heme peroxidase [Auriculariales sp. MPI-PUGE-AT-0066]
MHPLLSFSASLLSLQTVFSVTRGEPACVFSGSLANATCKCCKWYSILDDMQKNLFDEGSCGEEAHEALRLTFHDAVGYSTLANFKPGGADGSIITFGDIEQAYAGNEGVQDIAEELKYYADFYKVSYGDIIQFGGAVGLANCPGSPRVKFYANRPNATVVAPENLLLGPRDGGDKILWRMADVGFSPDEVVALMASHSTGRQASNTSRSKQAFDSTPTTMDTQFYLETLLKSKKNDPQLPGSVPPPVDGQFRLQSDVAIARHPLTACSWQNMIDNQMSLLGQTKSRLLDCSEVIPVPQTYSQRAYYPTGTSRLDVDQACKKSSWPNIAAAQSN